MGGEGKAWGGGAGRRGRSERRGGERERETQQASKRFLAFSVIVPRLSIKTVPIIQVLGALRSHTVRIQDLTQHKRTAGWETGKPASACCGVGGGRGGVQNAHELRGAGPCACLTRDGRVYLSVVIKGSLPTRKLKYSSQQFSASQ